MYICVRVLGLGRVQLFATPWTVAYQTPLSVGFFRQEYFCGLPFPTPGDLFNHGSTCISVISCIGITAPPGKPQVGRQQFQIQLLNIYDQTSFKHYMINYHEMMIHPEVMMVKIIKCYENPNKHRCEPSVNKLINV